MRIIMAAGELPDSNSGDSELGLQQEIDGLNSVVPGPSELGELLDGFMSMYHQLPESSFSEAVGGDITIQYTDGQNPWAFRPIANHALGLVVRDLTAPRSSQEPARHYVLLGSVYFVEVDMAQYGMDAVTRAIGAVAAHGKEHVGNIRIGEEESLRIAYTQAFCKNALLIHARAHTLDEVRGAAFKARTAHKAVDGRMITVQSSANQPFQLFVEALPNFTLAVQQALRRVGNIHVPLLSFIENE